MSGLLTIAFPLLAIFCSSYYAALSLGLVLLAAWRYGLTGACLTGTWAGLWGSVPCGAMLPSMLTQCIVIFQDTSLVYVIALGDFFSDAVRIGERDGTVVQMLLFAGFVYWVVCVLLSGIVTLLRGRLKSA